MAYRFEQSGMWLATLANQENDSTPREREYLRNAFYSFRKNTEALVGRIANALPGLVDTNFEGSVRIHLHRDAQNITLSVRDDGLRD
jgi:hypothetical protein